MKVWYDHTKGEECTQVGRQEPDDGSRKICAVQYCENIKQELKSGKSYRFTL